MNRILRDTRGMQLVELAIILPILLVLLFGIIEFGFLLYDEAVITNASREGARYASMYYVDPVTRDVVTHSCSDVQSYVQSYLTTHLFTFTGARNGDPFGCCGSGCTPSAGWLGSLYTPETLGNVTQSVQFITISYQYNFLVFGSVIKLLGGSMPGLTLQAQTAMMDENNIQY